MPETYILDSCVFNRLLDKRVCLSDISSNGVFVATLVQRGELEATKDEARSDQLLATFKQVSRRIDPTETFCFDISHLDFDKWGDGQLFTKLKATLDAKNGGAKIGAEYPKLNNARDALIAEVAIVQGFTLVTADRDLAEVAEEHGAKTFLV